MLVYFRGILIHIHSQLCYSHRNISPNEDCTHFDRFYNLRAMGSKNVILPRNLTKNNKSIISPNIEWGNVNDRSNVEEVH